MDRTSSNEYQNGIYGRWKCKGPCRNLVRPSRNRKGLRIVEAKSQRAVVVLPGLGNNSQDYKAVGEALESRGLHVQVGLPSACQLKRIIHMLPRILQ